MMLARSPLHGGGGNLVLRLLSTNFGHAPWFSLARPTQVLDLVYVSLRAKPNGEGADKRVVGDRASGLGLLEVGEG
jgi:hypothetical protein